MTNEPLRFGAYYHIYNRGNNGEILFAEPRNYPFLLQRYAKHIEPVAETYAYCLLPNHFHFAIRTRSEEEQEAYWHEQQRGRQIGPISAIGPIFKVQEPSRAFNNLFISYARAFNKAQGRTGTLFERPFGRRLIDSERYLKILIVYIHRNPQRHGLVDDFRRWTWSSYRTIGAYGATKLRRDEVLAWFDGRDGFIDAHMSFDWTNLGDWSNLGEP